MAQKVKCLPHEHKDLSQDPWNSKKASMAVHNCKPGVGNGDGGLLELQVKSETLSLKIM